MSDDNHIAEKFGIIEHRFTVLHEGWEMDNVGWAVRAPSGARKLILTSHGCAYEAKPEELDEMATQYVEALSGVITARATLNSRTGDE